MRYDQSYRSLWRVFRVNRDTWADAELIEDVDSIEITKTADGAVMESGTMEISGTLEEDYYRIVMTAEQGMAAERVEVATLLFSQSDGTYDYNSETQQLEGHSVLYPASVTVILEGEYAPAGVDGARYAGDLLQSVINAPVEVEGSFILNEHVVHEIGSSTLDAVWNVLTAGGFVMQIDGRGVVHIMPKPMEPSFVLDSTELRILNPGIDYTTDRSDIPNRYIVLDETSKTVAVNNSELSEISTVSRGYTVDMVDESPTPVNGETMSAYAVRRLHEESFEKIESTYSREYVGGVYVHSIVRASINSLEGDLRVKTQNISCKNGIKVTEEVVKEVDLWT